MCWWSIRWWSIRSWSIRSWSMLSSPRVERSPWGRESRSRRSGHTSASHRTKQTTKRSGWTTGQTVRVALRVHPWFGRKVVVLGPRGESIRAELPDGRTCFLPLAWTDWRPQLPPLSVNEQPVRLSPDGLRALAGWIRERVPRQKLDLADREDQKRGDGVAGEQGRVRAAAPAMVGKAGASGTRRSRRRSRGRRKR